LHPSRLKTDFQRSAQAIEAIIGHGSSLLNATSVDQLQRQSDRVSKLGTELEKTIFCVDHPAAHLAGLTEYKFSRSKWVDLDLELLTEPLEVYAPALVAMNDVIFVSFKFYRYVLSEDDYARVAELIRHLPSSVTSIYVDGSRRLPAIQRDTPLFINDNDRSNDIETFLHDNQLQLARTRRTHLFIDTGDYYGPSVSPARLELRPRSKIAVSFFGPPSGTLVLKLTHRFYGNAATLILKESHGSRTFKYPVPSSHTFTTTAITLSPSPSDHPSFEPDTRNNLIIEVTQGVLNYMKVQDIRLQDEAGDDYIAASPEA
jgi:hypothetical protein